MHILFRTVAFLVTIALMYSLLALAILSVNSVHWSIFC